jgi:acetolactate synthase-1/2/3 large subunit
VTYADDVCDWLAAEGYTHCFFVAGGNIMHLLNAARSRFVCVPFVHEVGAGIAAEYFNEAQIAPSGRAFALVTAGPGLTNIVTALAGAYLESRELLVIGGQVKAADLSRGLVRQRGIQEVDGVALAAPVCKKSVLVDKPLSRDEFTRYVRLTQSGRPGPVFLEVCLDVQGREGVADDDPVPAAAERRPQVVSPALLRQAADLINRAERPVLLLGGGVGRAHAAQILNLSRQLGIPCATTWNGADRISSEDSLYAGRPNTWGMRWANLVLQQADLIVAAGTRLGLQQTGFNWQEFAPVGTVIQIDIDPSELTKGHPVVDVAIEGDVNTVLPAMLAECLSNLPAGISAKRDSWHAHIVETRAALPLAAAENLTAPGYLDPYAFVEDLSRRLDGSEVIIPCSSGGAFTVTMQALHNKHDQIIVTDKGLASMGYGLSGAIGAALANRDRTVVLLEGDGGFAQNLQELGTLARQGLKVKIFLFSNEGYASIRMTQRNYFDGAYIGCDIATGLGMPDWKSLFSAYSIPCHDVDPDAAFSNAVRDLFASPGPAAFIVPIDPEQTYFPKITSRVTKSGSMESNPLHSMSPELGDALFARVVPHLQAPEENVHEPH